MADAQHEKHARFGADECPKKLERSRVLTMKYGKHQMVMIRKRMQVETWIEDQINKLFNGNEDHDITVDLDTLLDMPSPSDKKKFVFGLLQQRFCPASMDKITVFLDELMGQLQGL